MLRKSFLICLALPLIALAIYNGETLKINGKNVAGTVHTIDGKAYVPVAALKAAGAKINSANGVMTIDFPVMGGANQQAGVEGKVGDWLFNGIWRFKVVAVSKQAEGSGWKVDVEIRNGTQFNGYAPAGTGWQGVTMVLADGTILTARSDCPELRDTGVNQAAANTVSVYFDSDSSSEPDRLILRFDPKGIEGTPLKFSVPDPSFRVQLK